MGLINSTIFKEKPSGGFYCAECHMSFGELHTTCPYCGSFISNYEELLVRQEPPDIIIGGRWWEEPNELSGERLKANPLDDYIGDELDHELLEKIIAKVMKKEKGENEN